MRGYFGIGVEGISKPYNVGNLFRSAHAFGASFVFTVQAQYNRAQGARIDTSDSLGQLPFYSFPNREQMMLPRGCQLVGIELVDDSIELPSFRHPVQAAYILGPERGSLSNEMQAQCDFTIKIPTKFCLNVGIAGVVVMYDRLTSMGRFAPRPVRAGGPTEALPVHVQGSPVFRRENNLTEQGQAVQKQAAKNKPAPHVDGTAMEPYRTDAPLAEVKIAKDGPI